MQPLPPANLPAGPLTAMELRLLRAVDRLGDEPDDPDVAALRIPGDVLRAALVGLRVDVADDVLDLVDGDLPELREALAGLVWGPGGPQENDLTARVFEALDTPAVPLRDVLPAAPLDLADRIFAGLDDADAMLLSAFVDGDLSGEQRRQVSRRALSDSAVQAEVQGMARLGAQVREAATATEGLDLWGAIAGEIGADAGHVDGAEAVGIELRAAMSALPDIDVAAQVMAGVTPRELRIPMWASIGAPLVALAMAALVLLAIVPSLANHSASTGASLVQLSAPFVIASVNDAQVEALETSRDVVAQVVQFDDGGPTFILVDEAATGGTL